MDGSSAQEVRRLPLHDRHARLGAKFGAFGNWEVPLYYTSILEEHQSVRRHAGLFDISHMGEFFFRGENAAHFLDTLFPRRVPDMAIGQALYLPLLNEQAGIVDDVILYRFGRENFLAIVNAGNIEKDFSWISPRVPHGVDFEDASEQKGLLALQGPASAAVLERALSVSCASLGYYHFMEFQSGMIARTGYTGEDGFEIMADQKALPAIWDALLRAGAADGIRPVGFGARDTLRLEAGMLLHGHDMSEEVTPLEAGISWAVDWRKDFFLGRDALLGEKQRGSQRRLIGFRMIDRGIPRQGHEIRKGARRLGPVTSGSFSPTLQENIGLGYVPTEEAVPGQEIEIIIRERSLKAGIVRLPFYKRNK